MAEALSYAGLLNRLAVGESEAEHWFSAWADVTPNDDVRQVLRTVAIREGEHGKALVKRLSELGVQFEPSDGSDLAGRVGIASSTALTDREKFDKLQLTDAEANRSGQEFLSRIFEDQTFDVQTASLLGRYIAEERDSARMLDACYSTLTTPAQRNVSADAERRLARIESLLEDLLASR